MFEVHQLPLLLIHSVHVYETMCTRGFNTYPNERFTLRSHIRESMPSMLGKETNRLPTSGFSGFDVDV